MISLKRKLGDFGENIAREYLRRNGYHILNSNYTKPYGEIDIIASHKDVLVFIEVKTRVIKEVGYIPPEASVGYFKGRKIVRTAQVYLMEKHIPENTFWRIDVVSVDLNYTTRKAKVRHFENAIVE